MFSPDAPACGGALQLLVVGRVNWSLPPRKEQKQILSLLEMLEF